jgi:hypothetical protein
VEVEDGESRKVVPNVPIRLPKVTISPAALAEREPVLVATPIAVPPLNIAIFEPSLPVVAPGLTVAIT